VNRALDLERRALAIVPESRKIRGVVAHGKAAPILPSDWARALTLPNQLTRATALADTLNYQDAEKSLDAMATSMGARAAKGEVGCRTQVSVGSVLSKLRERTRAASLWNGFLPVPGLSRRHGRFPLFRRQSERVCQPCDEAIDRFARVEKDFASTGSRRCPAARRGGALDRW